MTPVATVDDEQERSSDQVRRYGRMLRRHPLAIGLTVAVVVGATIVLTFLQTPRYQSTARLLVQTRQSEQIVDSVQVARADAQRLVDTSIEVLRSSAVVDAVTQRLGFEPSVTIAGVGATDAVEIRATHPDPDKAALAADTYAEVYIEQSRDLAVQDLLSAGAEVQAKIDAIDEGVSALESEVSRLDVAILTAAPEARDALVAERQAVQERLDGERATQADQRSYFVQERDRLEVASSLSERGGAQLIGPAKAASSPFTPSWIRNVSIAVLLGALLAATLAFLLELFDDRVKSKSDLELATGGLPVLGLIPTAVDPKHPDRAYLVSVEAPTSSAAEAFRSLRTSVQFLGIDRPIRVLQVTSVRPGEGKSTTSANLGVAFARAGQRVVLVCCDWRRPRLHGHFGIGNKVGMTSLLLGEASLADAAHTVPSEPNLVVLPSGPPAPNPSELLASPRMREVLASLEEVADLVIIDTPPVLPVADAAVVSGLVDATLLVARAGFSNRRSLRSGLDVLGQVDAPLIGAVLLGADTKDDHGYGDGYAYIYQPGHPYAGRVRVGRTAAAFLADESEPSTTSRRKASG